MKTNKLFKLGIFLFLTALCFALDAGLGMFSGTMFIALAGAGVAGEPDNADEKPAIPEVKKNGIEPDEVKNMVNTAVDTKITELTHKFETEIRNVKDKADGLEGLFRNNGARVQDADKKEFNNMLRNGIKALVNGRALPEEFRNGYMNETTDASGAYAVPVELYNQILDKTATFSTILRNAQIYKMNSKTLKLLKTASNPTFSYDGEATARAVSGATLGQVLLSRKDGGFIVVFSKQLLEDEAFDLQAYITMLAAKAYANAVETAGYTGVVSPEIIGLLGASGTTDVEMSGTNILTDFSYDQLFDVIATPPAADLLSSKFYMHRLMWALIKKLKTGTGASAKYVLSDADRIAQKIEGFPVELTDMALTPATATAGTKALFFGDLSNMAFGMRQGFTLDFSKDATIVDGGSTYNLFQQGMIALNFGASHDIKYTFPTAIAAYKVKDA